MLEKLTGNFARISARGSGQKVIMDKLSSRILGNLMNHDQLREASKIRTKRNWSRKQPPICTAY